MAVYPAKDKYDAEDLIAIVTLLRDPVSGCPWDKVQTHQSIRKNFLEETYEVLEALDAGDPVMLREELGDVMMQVALHSCMEQEKGTFDFTDVCDEVCRKLLYRHPHIFSSGAGQSAGLNDWDALKNKEKGRRDLADELNTVPVTLPALMKAQKTQKRAAGYGAVTQDADKAYAEMRKSEQALAEALAKPVPQPVPGDCVQPHPAEQQAGDFLFAAANWMRCAGLDAEEVLEKSIHRFHAAHGGD
jgi:MazG family protein